MEAAVVALDLEAADRVLEEQGEEAVVLVRADALVGAVARTAGVADQLEVRVGVGAEDRVVEAGRGADGGEQLAQQALGDRAELVDPGERGRAQLGQGGGPLVGALEPPVRRLAGAGYAGRALGADVELVAPVAGAAGALVAGTGVAPEVGELMLSRASRSASGSAKKARMAEVRASVSACVTPCPVNWKKPTSWAALCSRAWKRARSSGPRSAAERSMIGSWAYDGSVA